MKIEITKTQASSNWGGVEMHFTNKDNIHFPFKLLAFIYVDGLLWGKKEVRHFGTFFYLHQAKKEQALPENKKVYLEIHEDILIEYRILELIYDENGYVREKGLFLLKQNLQPFINNDQVFFALLKRLNDWVARNTKFGTLGHGYVASAMRQQLFVEKPEKHSSFTNLWKVDHSKFVLFIDKRLCSDNHFLEEKVLSTDFMIARNAITLLENLDGFNLKKILNNHKDIHDIVVKRKISAIIIELTEEEFKPLSKELYKSKSSYIRREALRAFCKYDIERICRIKESLFDKSSLVRETAWYVAKRYGLDAVKIYKQTLLENIRCTPEIVKITSRMVYDFKIEELEDILWSIFRTA